MFDATAPAPDPSQVSAIAGGGSGQVGSPFAETWAHFDLGLGLSEYLLPVVADHTIAPSPRSQVKQLGKVPSRVIASGAVGFPNWTQHATTTNEIDRWSSDPRLGVCIRTAKVRALDIDVDDERAAAIADVFTLITGKLPLRFRSNSHKILLAFIVEGDLRKRSFKVEGGLIELLAGGQQFIVDSIHPSGVRYEWAGGLPVEIPVLPPETFEKAWATIVERFAVEAPHEAGVRLREESFAAEDPVAEHLHDQGLVIGGDDEKLFIRCPWAGDHSGESGPSETAWLVAGSSGYSEGHFQCQHASCAKRTDGDFFAAVGYVEDVSSDFDDLGPLPAEDRKRSRFELLPAGEYIQGPAPAWLVKGVLPEAALGVVYGASGSGKTFFVLDLVAAVARGAPWRDRKVKQRTVAYVCAEGAAGFRNRIQAYLRQNDGADFGNQFLVMSQPPNLLAANDGRELVDVIKSAGAGVVVVDTFAQVTPGADENSGKDVGTALKVCRDLHVATGALVLLVHHSGKDASRGARGWSGLRAAADLEIEVARNDTAHVATITKMKDGEDGQSFGFRLSPILLGLDEDDDEITSCIVSPCDFTPTPPVVRRGANQMAVINALSDLMPLAGGGVQRDDVVAATIGAMPLEGTRDRRRDVALRALKLLIDQGVIVERNGILHLANGDVGACE